MGNLKYRISIEYSRVCKNEKPLHLHATVYYQ